VIDHLYCALSQSNAVLKNVKSEPDLMVDDDDDLVDEDNLFAEGNENNDGEEYMTFEKIEVRERFYWSRFAVRFFPR
jgi:hypothetical protein